MDKKQLLRRIPKMDELLNEEIVKLEAGTTMKEIVMESLREAVDNYRNLILKGKIENFTKEDILKSFRIIIEQKKQPNLKNVINATGVIIHTNLGRSILSDGALKNVIDAAHNYSNLEYDLEKGTRGSRYSHVEELIKRITGAEASLVVNNNAAAVVLVLNTLCSGKEAIVSRGQLVEIGGSFRIPEVMEFSGVNLVEVGTTNKTHLKDYENALSENTGAFLKVHTSNFKIIGFSEEVSLEELVKLSLKSRIPVVEDIGSGTLVDFSKYGFEYEPTVQKSIDKGVDVVTFSGDKMLGGPQAGIIVGKKKYIDKMKQNQLTRALRIDKMTLAALEGTLKYYLDESEAIKNIPTLHMILAGEDEQKRRAFILKEKLENKNLNFKFAVEEDNSMVGGGSMPGQKIPTYVIKAESSSVSPEQVDKKFRKRRVPIIVRLAHNQVIMDLRTILDRDFDVLVDAFTEL